MWLLSPMIKNALKIPKCSVQVLLIVVEKEKSASDQTTTILTLISKVQDVSNDI